LSPSVWAFLHSHRAPAQTPDSSNVRKGERKEQKGIADQKKGERLENKGAAQVKAGNKLESEGKPEAGEKLENKGVKNEKRGEHFEKKGARLQKQERRSKTRVRSNSKRAGAFPSSESRSLQNSRRSICRRGL
jgi:hypothetical protein